MTDDELQAIESRLTAILELPITDINAEGWFTSEGFVREDAPQLIAEVRRLLKFLRDIGEVTAMPVDKPEAIVDALRNYRTDDARFQEWAQGYLEQGQWSGHDRGEAIKAELLARDAEVRRLRGLCEELRVNVAAMKP